MGGTESTDRDVWRAVLSGDSHAFGTLFDRHRDRVFGHALRLIAHRTDAEDLTALVFLELWRRRHRVRFVDDSLLPWLLVTTRNVSRNAARAHRRHAKVLAKLPPGQAQPDFSEAADTRLDAEHNRIAIANAISDLQPIDQDLIALTALENMTLLEASEAVGVSYGTAKTRLSRARAKLRRTLPTHMLQEGTTP